MSMAQSTHKKTYYDAYKRARGVTYDDLRKQKLLTDRGAYMTFLEEKSPFDSFVVDCPRFR